MRELAYALVGFLFILLVFFLNLGPLAMGVLALCKLTGLMAISWSPVVTLAVLWALSLFLVVLCLAIQQQENERRTRAFHRRMFRR